MTLIQFLYGSIIVVSILLVISIFMQPAKAQGFQGEVNNDMYGKNKGLEALLKKVTTFLMIVFFILALTISVVQFK